MEENQRKDSTIQVSGQGNQVAGGNIDKSENRHNFFTDEEKNKEITVKKFTAIISLIVSFIIGFLSSLLASYIFEHYFRN